MLKRTEFAVLEALRRAPGSSQASLARAAGLSPSSVSQAMRRLAQRGLVAQRRVTDQGLAELEPHRVENAIIMAAGISSRFAPISYEKPKGLLIVRGERLIERQIRQLREAGIERIAVVVGYRKEQYFYLEREFGVSIVVNPDYAERNNHSSLYHARELLGRTYVCSSDNYFEENPFAPYAWRAHYAVQHAAGETGEWVVRTGANRLIEGLSIGGSDAWYLIGPAYFDEAFSQRFVGILERAYRDPGAAPKLWEQLYREHVGELRMEARPFDPPIIHEFDRLDDLREFDTDYLVNLDSAIFERIEGALGCDRSEIRDVYPLKQGLTNLSCHFATSEGEYVYRHPGVGTERMLDRAAEMQALELARRIGIDRTFICGDARTGWKLSRFIPDCRELDPHDDAQLAEAMRLARRLHAEEVRLARRFGFFSEGCRYERILGERALRQIPDYAGLRERAARLDALVRADGARECLTHNDFFNLNLLYDAEGSLSLIDWEYAGTSDYASDFGTFVVSCRLSDEEAERALALYG